MNLLKLARAATSILTATATPAAYRLRQWRVAYPKNDIMMTVLFTPPATAADVQAIYPDAAIEPIPDTPARPATKAEADELAALVALILADATDDERAEALRIALADREAALTSFRALALAYRGRPNPWHREPETVRVHSLP